MKLRDLIALIVDNLRRMKGRVMATALGVVVGTAAVVVLISLGAGLQRQALERLRGGVSEIRITGALNTSNARASSGTSTGRPPSANRPTSNRQASAVTDAAVLAEIGTLPGVEWAIGFEPLMAAADLQVGRQCVRSVRAVGLAPDELKRLGLRVASGTLDLRRGQVVLGARVAQKLMGAGDVDPQGQVLRLYLARFGADGTPMEKVVRVEVVGVLAPSGGTHDTSLYIEKREALMINTWLMAQRRDPGRQGYSEVLIKVADVEQTQAVEGSLAAMGLNVFSERRYAESVSVYFGELQALLGGIAAISLLVAAFSIANTMLMAIFERTREIGLLKAIGASNRDVMLVFLGEAGAIGLLGGVTGTGLGLVINGVINLLGGQVAWLAQMYGSATRLQACTPVWLPFLAVGFAVVIGVIAGAWPARRAARMSPLRALKSR